MELSLEAWAEGLGAAPPQIATGHLAPARRSVDDLEEMS